MRTSGVVRLASSGESGALEAISGCAGGVRLAGPADGRVSQSPFQTDERLQLIGEPLSESFRVQLDVPVGDYGIAGRDQTLNLLGRHIELVEDPDHRRVLIYVGIRGPDPSSLLRSITFLPR